MDSEMTRLRRLNSYGEERLYARVQNLILEKIILVQEENLETILQ
jgi:hypothetical protein